MHPSLGSHHKNRGWKSQLARVRRWHKRVDKIGRAMSAKHDMEQEHDDVYAFSQNCYHLRHWLDAAQVVLTKDLDEFFSQNVEMQLCRDICNGTKHLEISHPSVDENFSIGREYVEAEDSIERPHINEMWNIITVKGKHDVFDLASRCMHLWEEFIKEHRLEG